VKYLHYQSESVNAAPAAVAEEGIAMESPSGGLRKRLPVVCACAWLAACSGGAGGAGPDPGPGPGSPGSALAQFATCEDLRGAIVADAGRKIELQADRLRSDGYVVARDVDFAGPVPAPGAPAPDEGGGPDDFTDTNVQVEGVDEADVVETDGAHVYLLHEQRLLVLDSFPPEATALRSELAIEGSPAGMFVVAGRALVLSHVSDAGELGGDDACRYIGVPLPEPVVRARDVFVPCGPPFTKLTLVDLTGDSPRVAREIYLEGYYTAARRHGGRVRVVVQRGWGLPVGVPEPWSSIWESGPPASREEFIERVDAWEAAALAALEASSLAEWLPAQKERVGGSLVDVPSSCSDVHVPPPGLAGDGASTIFALDMSADDGAVRDTLVMGGAAQVYANLDTLVLGQPDWSWYDAGEDTDRTSVHVFALPEESLETGYLASGFVPGTPLSQLSFDVRDGIVRVATTLTSRELTAPEAPPTASRVTTLRVEAESLVVVGSTADLAPGERIFSARFLGDRAYLVTFLQIDPLFVIDLADPAAPRVLGEVELPGFSEYIHPLGTDHLLTVGRDADADGRARGVALRIFDVSSPAAPSLEHVQLLPGEGWSPAESDHLAFTFDARLGLLALPYNRYDGSYRSSLVLLDVDAATGFSVRGEIDHGGTGAEPCPPDGLVPCGTDVEMRRGLFIEDAVYSISNAAVVVNALADLATPVAQVDLPSSTGPLPEPIPLRE
jgi:uncharacterized secreted protein with C-terminal beta-propeller domain